jgi:hypothetical protein
MAELTDEQRSMLDFERQHWRYVGGKESEVRQRFGRTLASYQKELNALLDRPEALAHAPATVRRLRRQRQKRLVQRREDRASA